MGGAITRDLASVYFINRQTKKKPFSRTSFKHKVKSEEFGANLPGRMSDDYFNKSLWHCF